MPQQIITFHYTLTDNEGKQLDSSREKDQPISFLEGSGQIIPGLEEELTKMTAGDKQAVTVPKEKAYGVYDQKKIHQVPRSQFPPQEAKVGDMFRMGTREQSQVVTIIDITETQVTLDANHPLAGKDLSFDVEIVAKRDASEEEIQHGHAHGPEGHQH